MNKLTMTGMKFRRASSIGDIFKNPATATKDDQAMIVPPPVQIAPIWPIAAMVDASILALEAKAPDSAPVKGSPEKPDPSKPVIMPIKRMPYPAKIEFCGMYTCPAWIASNRNAGVAASSPSDKMEGVKSLLPMKKNPAIGITGAIALNANTKPSVKCSLIWSRECMRFNAMVAKTNRIVATPPTKAAPSVPSNPEPPVILNWNM